MENQLKSVQTNGSYRHSFEQHDRQMENYGAVKTPACYSYPIPYLQDINDKVINKISQTKTCGAALFFKLRWVKQYFYWLCIKVKRTGHLRLVVNSFERVDSWIVGPLNSIVFISIITFIYMHFFFFIELYFLNWLNG